MGKFALQYWDLAGQDRFEVVTPDYLRGVDIGMLVYDSKASLENPDEVKDKLSFWYENLKKHNPEAIFCIGTKYDLLNEEEKNKIRKDNLGNEFVDQNKSILSSIKGGDENFHNNLDMTLKSYLNNLVKDVKIEEETITKKICFCGAGGAGKTTLIGMLRNDGKPPENPEETIGIGFTVQYCNVKL